VVVAVRYDVAPLPALYGLDPDLVIYLGSVTKTLTPGWRTSSSKVLDNAIIGYCKLNEITPAQT
jgi:GntR family transcriptional regulator / MocR family aminotransferase